MDCFFVLSPGRDKGAHSYETVTQVEGKAGKNKKTKGFFNTVILLILSFLAVLSLKFTTRGPSSSWAPSRTG